MEKFRIKRMHRQVLLLSGCLTILLLMSMIAKSQDVAKKSTGEVYVDNNGVMRWGKTKEEVHAFGINYTVPFAYAYRAGKKLGIPLEKAIDNDVYHFARLGFDCFRVHVWDCEISDTLGNLLNNEHLKLFDYLLMKMKERGMKLIITPIAFWPNGYPEPPEKTPGFATKYGKEACLTDPGAIKAQEQYLYQFLNHVNAYTGVAYKEDPDIIAFEVCNEPHHRESPGKVTEFINRMVASMRNTGCKRPIFYNISHSIQLTDAYFNSNIQGGTFQWYPTGLGARHELRGNLLPNVDKYTIPFAGNPRFKKIAKIVYEFDAADVGRSYIYPAMARSFREAGIQVATHFSYDPTYLAFANTEYSTHYMNLAYAPPKAISLKIASEVFHRIPMNKSFGTYPANTSFDVFKVSYEHDLAEMISDDKFFYTNHTNSHPLAPDKLQHIAGCGSSPLVTYDGTGAYFIDQLEKGVWRLEVMPDAIWVSDPFERTSLRKEVAIINWRAWPMTINLPDLGADYEIKPLNEMAGTSAKAVERSISISPGTYLLTGPGTHAKHEGDDRWNNITLKEFAAPATTLRKTYVLHKPWNEISTGSPCKIEATIVSADEPESVELSVLAGGFRPEVLKMEKTKGYQYEVSLPEKMIHEGFLKYYISVKEKGSYRTYPAGLGGHPSDWDYYDQNTYQTRMVSSTAPMYLFNATTDTDEMARPWIRGSSLVPASEPGKGELLVNVEKLFADDPENKNAEKRYDYSFRYSFTPKIQGRAQDLSTKHKLIFHGRSLNEKPCKLALALVMKDGSAYGGVITVDRERAEYSLSLTDLKRVKTVNLPRPYPTFLPYYFDCEMPGTFDINAVESLQFSLGPGMAEDELNGKHGIAIQTVRLE